MKILCVSRTHSIKEEVEKMMCDQRNGEVKQLLSMQNKLTFQCGQASYHMKANANRQSKQNQRGEIPWVKSVEVYFSDALFANKLLFLNTSLRIRSGLVWIKMLRGWQIHRCISFELIKSELLLWPYSFLLSITHASMCWILHLSPQCW